MVICPELTHCFSEGGTIEEATANIKNVIADFLPEEANASAEDEESLRIGLCMRDKIFQGMRVTMDKSGEIVFDRAETLAST